MYSTDDPQMTAACRSYRPASRASSSQSKATTHSSNGSGLNLQSRNISGLRDRERAQDKGHNDRRDSPGALLLQERLKEKKAAMMNEHRIGSDADGSGEERGAHCMPRNASMTRSARDRDVTPSSNGERSMGKTGMG